jgi:integrase/recombinase XerC
LELDDVEMTSRTGRLYIRSGKGDKSGTVPLNALARKAIRDWLAVRPKSLSKRLFLGRRSSGRKDGLTPSAVQRRFNIIGRRANVEVSPHDLRHTFATRLRERGVSPIIIKELMRLETMEMVSRYSQPCARDLENSVNQLVG